MTRVDFYILSEAHSRLGFAARLSERIYRLGKKLHIHTADPAMSAQIDTLLWSYRDISFIPHEQYQGNAPDSPVTISHALEPPEHDVLLNLATDVPEFFSRFERVVEIIDTDDSQRQQGRLRYRFYNDRGYELASHTID